MTPSSSHPSQASFAGERRGGVPSGAHGATPTNSSSNSSSTGPAFSPAGDNRKQEGVSSVTASSNFLARALHQAIVGAEYASHLDPIRGDTDSVRKLVRLATISELGEANEDMRRAYGFDLTTYLETLIGPEQRSLAAALREKGIISDSLSSPSNGDRLRLEFLQREFHQANIFPIKVIPKPIEEKLELLDVYLDRLERGLERYPELIARLERSLRRQEELKIEVSVNLQASIKRGEWNEIEGHPVSPQKVIEYADRCTRRARQLVNELQRFPQGMTVKSLTELVANLDVSTRITHLYARDFYEEARVTFAEAKPTGAWERFWRVKPTEACEAAIGALFTRRYLILRAIGVSTFVDHMRKSLQMP